MSSHKKRKKKWSIRWSFEWLSTTKTTSRREACRRHACWTSGKKKDGGNARRSRTGRWCMSGLRNLYMYMYSALSLSLSRELTRIRAALHGNREIQIQSVVTRAPVSPWTVARARAHHHHAWRAVTLRKLYRCAVAFHGGGTFTFFFFCCCLLVVGVCSSHSLDMEESEKDESEFFLFGLDWWWICWYSYRSGKCTLDLVTFIKNEEAHTDDYF